MIPKVVAYDWAHKTSKKKFFDGNGFLTLESLPRDSVIVTENVPAKEAKRLMDAGHTVFRCNTNAVAEIRENEGLEKSDETDVSIIYKLWRTKPELFREYRLESPVKIMYAVMKEIGKVRISMQNRVWHNNDARCVEVLKLLEKAENQAEKAIKEEAGNQEIFTWLVGLRGVGTRLAGGLLAITGEISRFDTVSKLWSYFGWAVKNGSIQRKIKGEKASWNHKGKALTFLFVDEFIKFRTEPYRSIYDEEKAKQIRNGLKKSHAHRRAVRKTAKIFLEHFWVKYRQIKGLPIGQPYSIAKLQHEHYIEASAILPCASQTTLETHSSGASHQSV